MNLDSINQRFLNDFQHSFPLQPEPYKVLAGKLSLDAQSVLERARELHSIGSISRIGPVFRPNTIGVSTLAAISVPTEDIERYAMLVNQFDQVNHNYEREHEINLWFVLTAGNQTELDDTIAGIERVTERSVLVLPLLQEYHIDLGFKMLHLNTSQKFSEPSTSIQKNSLDEMNAKELKSLKHLTAAIQDGLPLVERPYQALAQQLGWTESRVIDGLKRLIASGTIKRFGVVVRHHEMGYRANAMVVWNVPDDQVDALGERLGQVPCVTLCYLRPRVLPRWPYNLFFMIHGQDRYEVRACIGQIRVDYNLEQIDHHILFSGRRFKQRGARYHSKGINI